ncbi:MAG TPA: PKD domain-containing protein [Gaiellaceae bacterium]
MVGFYYTPGDPSIFDTVQFYDQSFDPAGVGIASETWSFGDGATAAGSCPTHRYAADGTYTLTLTVTMTDGRTASTSRDVFVRTHDVAVARMAVPETARVGETATIAIGLANGRYPETVQVRLLKSLPGGDWRQVGALTRPVPVRRGGGTTDFDFEYAFAPEDAEAGEVRFRALATILGARDAMRSGNSFISPATRVRP